MEGVQAGMKGMMIRRRNDCCVKRYSLEWVNGFEAYSLAD
jgi:hypothetical protein